MKFYVCCPNEDCRDFQKALSWLHSFGIEPSIGCDGDDNYFDFNIPEEWDLQCKIDFTSALCEKTTVSVYCVCGRWFEDECEGEVIVRKCTGCKKKYRFCADCDAFEYWKGCDCNNKKKRKKK